MTAHPICDDPGATDDWGSRKGHRRSHAVTIHFSPITRDIRDIDAKMVPNDLARQDASKDMQFDLLGSWPDLGVTWPGLRSNFEIDLSRAKGTCLEPALRGEHDVVIIIFTSPMSIKLSMANHLRKKRSFFI